VGVKATYGGVCVEMATHVLDFKLQLLLCPLLRALYHLLALGIGMGVKGKHLEGKMLEEVCGAIGLIRLCTTSGIYPNTDGRRLGPGRVLSGDLELALATVIAIDTHPTYGEAIAQRGALGCAAVTDGSSKVSCERAEGVDRLAGTQALVQIEG
jgi:hypothetical protein